MGTSLCVLPPKILASCISQEVVRNEEEEEVARDSTNNPTHVSSSVASSLYQETIFHEDSIRVASITIAEELLIHSMSFSSMSSVTNGEYVLLFDVHSESSLEDGFFSHESIGSKYGEVWMSSEYLSLLHILFPMYSSTMTSRVPSSSFEDGEAFSIIMAHLPGDNYNLHSQLMLQDPCESIGITYSQALQVSFGHGILFGLRLKSKEHHSLSYECISVVLHGLRIHHATIPNLVEHISLLPKKKIHPEIF